MPGIVTHLYFAEDVLECTPALGGIPSLERTSFTLGSQGPDPLLFASMRVANPSLYTIGTRMHNERTAELLAAMFAAADGLEERRCGIARAYALGFVCHYLLDNAVHPLVYAQQYACCAVKGIRGLGMRSLSEAHACIETGIDEMLMVRRVGRETAANLDIASAALPCDPDVLDAVSELFERVIPKVYGLSVPPGFFESCTRGYNRVERAVDYMRRNDVIPAWAPAGIFHLLPFFRQLGHRADPNARTPFANDDHLPWEFPFEPRRTVSESFDELYGKALERACGLLPQLNQATLTLSGATTLASGLNFKGAAIR